MNYRSTDPAVIEAWESFVTAQRAWTAAVAAMPRPPVPDGSTFTPEPMAVTSTGGGRRLVGFSWSYDLPIPEGWKKEGKGFPYTISPKQSTPIGKAARKTFPLGSASLTLPGMPSTMWVGLSLRSPGIEERDGEIRVHWGDGCIPEGVDPAIWTSDLDLPVVFS